MASVRAATGTSRTSRHTWRPSIPTSIRATKPPAGVDGVTREQAQDLCEALAVATVEALRRRNAAWDTYHGVAASVSDAEYERAIHEVADALWRRTGFAGARRERVGV